MTICFICKKEIKERDNQGNLTNEYIDHLMDCPPQMKLIMKRLSQI